MSAASSPLVKEFLSKIIPLEPAADESSVQQFLKETLPVDVEPLQPSEIQDFRTFLAEKLLQQRVEQTPKVEVKTITAPQKQEKAAAPSLVPIFRVFEENLEWKYTSEKEWRKLVSLQEIADRVHIPERLQDAEDYGAHNVDDTIYGGGGGGRAAARPEFKEENGIIYYKLETDDEEAWMPIFEVPLPAGEEPMRTKRIDMVEDLIYTGEAEVGSANADPVWRISRTYIAPDDGDVTVLWANGTAGFDKAWDDHLALNYS